MNDYDNWTTPIARARSVLFVPGDRPERVATAMTSGAGLTVVDLEDSVAPVDKERARDTVSRLAEEGGKFAVRVAAVGAEGHADDLAAIARNPRPVMLAKAESPEDIAEVVGALRSSVPIIALIETAAGVLAATSTAAAPGVHRMALGTLDLAAELGVDHRDRDSLAAARAAIVLAAAAAGLAAPLDGVTDDPTDDDILAADVAHARRLGFGGTLCIHPRQLAVVHRGYAATAEDIEWARRVLAAAESSPSGVTSLDGRMVDRPVVLRARGILESADTTMEGVHE